MRISKRAEYACSAMLELAARHGSPEPARIKAIAKAQNIDSDRFLVQILIRLKEAGLVASVRGASGGYHLARSPESITLAQIIDAVENRDPEPLPFQDAPRTPIVDALLSVWQEIRAQEQRHLAQLSLAELLRRTQSFDSLNYVI